MTTPAKSALDEARERLEKLCGETAQFRTWVRRGDLRLVLDALREAESVVEGFKVAVNLQAMLPGDHETFCEYCGGNDEDPQDHCMDCERPSTKDPQ